MNYLPAVLAVILIFTGARGHAETHFVRVAGDDFQNPPEGSLRHALYELAKPGDTIKFASPLVVTLVDALIIPPTLAGLTIEGPGQIGFKPEGPNEGTPVSVRAGQVTLFNLTLKNCFVSAVAKDGSQLLPGLKVRQCTFTGRGGIQLGFTSGVRLENNEFRVNNRVQEQVIALVETTDTMVIDNKFEVLGGEGIQSLLDRNLVLQNNTSNAPFFLSVRNATLRNNTVPRRAITVYQGAQEGPIVVEDNVCAFLRVIGVDLSVQRNKVDGRKFQRRDFDLPGSPLIDDGEPPAALTVAVGLNAGQDPYSGPVIVAGNELTGGVIGLTYSQQTATPDARVERNIIKDSIQQGMHLDVSAPVTVADNEVSGCKGSKGGPKAGIRISAGTADLRLVSNDVFDNRCAGIVIYPPATATLLDNTIKNCRGSGLVVSGGASVFAENNTLEENKRSGLFLDPLSAATLKGNTMQKNEQGGIVVSADAVLTGENVTVQDNLAHGILFKRTGSGTVTGGTIRRNKGAGVSVVGGAFAAIRQVRFSENRGAGIDLAPGGVTPNKKTKDGNADIDFPDELEFEPGSRLIRGSAERGSIVELFRVESGDRQGNPKNGEGILFVAAAVTEPDGTFSVPVGPSAEGDKFCLTATRAGEPAVTSEFSLDIEVTPTPPIERVSVSSAEQEGNAFSGDFTARPRISDDGRFAAFSSAASNLVSNDNNQGTDVFVRDRMSGTTERVSVNSAGEEAREEGPFNILPHSSSEAVSGDGRWVVFTSNATNLEPGDINSDVDVFLRDRQTGTTVAVVDPTEQDPPLPSGASHHQGTHDPAISADGNVVAFVTIDRDLIANDTNLEDDVYVWVRATNSYERVSVTSAGGQLPFGINPGTAAPRLSADGRFVVFQCAGTLVPGNPPPGVAVYLRDRVNQTTELVSYNAQGAATKGSQPAMSADGRYVAFVTDAVLLPTDVNGGPDVYLRDRQTGGVEIVSLNPEGEQFTPSSQQPIAEPSLDAAARFIAFLGPGSATDGGPTVLVHDLFVRDRLKGTTAEESIGVNGDALGHSGGPALSADGRYLSFQSFGDNLVDNDTNGVADVFVRDRSDELGEARKD